MKLKIIKKGIADSLQNAGNYGDQHIGVQVGGYMDFLSAQLANKIVGNTLKQYVYEIHFPASHFEFEEDGLIAITGANFVPVINENSIVMNKVVEIKKGDILQFLQPIQGRISYLAMSNKKSTSIYINNPLIELVNQWIFTPAPIRFIPGPAWKDLSPDAIHHLMHGTFYSSLQSNRMGLQLNGPLLSTMNNKSYLSSGVTRGTMQLLPNGQMIILMADHQTIGGYPNLGQIILVDLPRLAQMAPQPPIHFRLCNVATAHEQYQFIQTQFAN